MGLSNRKYDELMKEYKQRQADSRMRLEAHRKQIYELIPEYKVCDDRIVDLSIEKAKKLVLGSAEDITALKSEISSLSSQKEELLSSHGFAKNYMEPVYICSDCRDTGYIENEKCHCLKQKLIELLYEQSNLKSVLSDENFSNFSFDYYDDSEKARMQKVVSDAKFFVENFHDDYHNFLFYGNVGCGKTFLSNCIAKELIEQGFSVIYFTAFQLFEILARNTFEGREATSDKKEFYDDIFSCDLLIIDDLGTETGNSFTKSQLFLILNERLNRKKSTLISSNLSLEKMVDIYSERSLSRIMGNYNMYKFMGKDIRVIKSKQRRKVNDHL